jgi:hypothetical protein
VSFKLLGTSLPAPFAGRFRRRTEHAAVLPGEVRVVGVLKLRRERGKVGLGGRKQCGRCVLESSALDQPFQGLVAGDPAQGVTYSLALYVPNVDEVTATARAQGATIREPATTFVSGDRFASIFDPFGVRWSIMTRVEDLSPEESARRVAAWTAAQQA